MVVLQLTLTSIYEIDDFNINFTKPLFCRFSVVRNYLCGEKAAQDANRMQNGCTKGDPYALYHDSGWQESQP